MTVFNMEHLVSTQSNLSFLSLGLEEQTEIIVATLLARTVNLPVLQSCFQILIPNTPVRMKHFFNETFFNIGATYHIEWHSHFAPRGPVFNSWRSRDCFS